MFERLAEIITTNEHRAMLVRFYTVMMGESLTDDHPAGPFFAERFERLRIAVADAIWDAETPRNPALTRDEVLVRAALYIAVGYP